MLWFKFRNQGFAGKKRMRFALSSQNECTNVVIFTEVFI